jgi:hypothetical protein
MMEALAYFKNKQAEFAANQFSPKEALAFCKKLYKLGAKKVEIDFDENYNYEEDMRVEVYADTMIITLPKPATKRIDLMAAIFEERPDEITKDTVYDRAVNWKKDSSVVLWWD